MPRLTNAVPKYRKHSSGNARVTINGRDYLLGPHGKLPGSVFETLRLIPGLKRGRTEARETKPVQPVPIEDVEETLAHMAAIPDDMVRVQLLTGCRPGEVCKLTPAMIDRSGDVWVASLDEHKTAHHGHKRILYFGPKAQEILKTYLLSA